MVIVSTVLVSSLTRKIILRPLRLLILYSLRGSLNFRTCKTPYRGIRSPTNGSSARPFMVLVMDDWLFGNFFRIFARLHAKGNFPTVSLVVLGLIASVFSLGSLPDVIGSLVATRVIIQYLPQAIGLFVLRFRAPNLERPFKMWLFPIPGIISVLGWLYLLGTAKAKSLLFAFAVLLIGSAVFFVRSKIRHEWPFPSSQTYPGQS